VTVVGRASELSGFTVGLTDGTDAGDQAKWFARRGAAIVVGPVLRSSSTADSSGAGRVDGTGLPADVGPALRLVDMLCRGSVHAVTFTVGPAVRNFMAVADRSRRGRNLLAALNRNVIVACSDLASAAAAREEGIERPRAPDDGRLDSLLEMVRAELLQRRRCYRVGPNQLVLQGSAVLVDGTPVVLGEPERAVLAKLAEHPGRTVSRRILLRHVWKDPSVGPEVLERAVESLRLGLGPPGGAVESAPRKGYRLRVIET
jgi:uroporphyrinogen-III synthase